MPRGPRPIRAQTAHPRARFSWSGPHRAIPSGAVCAPVRILLGRLSDPARRPLACWFPEATPAWRKSYGLLASGEATWAGVKASLRPFCSTCHNVDGRHRRPLQGRNSRPSGPVPCCSTCSRIMATSTGGIGTRLIALRGPRLGLLACWTSPSSVQSRCAVRILIPDTGRPWAISCRAQDLADEPASRQRAEAITRRHTDAITESVAELADLGLDLRRHRRRNGRRAAPRHPPHRRLRPARPRDDDRRSPGSLPARRDSQS